MFGEPSPTRRARLPQRLFTDRLFFAIFPDPGTAARIAQLRQELRLELGLQGKPLASERLHATLHPVGDYAGLPQDIVVRAGDGAVGLMMLQQRLGLAMAGAGLGRSAPHYTPHLTLLYADRLIADRRVDTVSWAVREFVLVHSLLGRSCYRPLARFPLSQA